MEKKEITVSIRFTVDLKKRLEQQAQIDGRSFNREVLWILENWFKLGIKDKAHYLEMAMQTDSAKAIQNKDSKAA